MTNKNEIGKNKNELLEYFETCKTFENNLDKEIQTQYQKYQDTKRTL